MKLVDLIISNQCNHLYWRYLKIVDNPKLSHLITSKQICKEIVSYYNQDYHHVLNVLSETEINFLKHYPTNHNYQDLPIINSLINKCLLIKDINNKNYITIPDDLKEIVFKAINLADISKIKRIDQINELLIGILAIRGVINVDDLIAFYLKYDSSISHDTLKKHIDTNRYLIWHYFIYQGDDGLLLAYEPYQVYIDKIVNNQKIVSEVDFTYNKHQIQLIARYGLDIEHNCINCLYREIESINSYLLKEMIRNLIIQTCQTCEDENKLIKTIKQLQQDTNENLNYLITLIPKALPYIHSAGLYGLSPNEYYHLIHQASSFTKEESTAFYQLYLNLLEYTNQQFNITTISFHELDEVDPIDFSYVRTLLFNNPEIIDRYLNEDPDHLNNEAKKIIENFKEGFIDEFLILKNNDDYSIVSNNSDVYAIYGLVSHLKEIYPDKVLPKVCNLAILPYLNKIVFDGILEDHPNLRPTNQIKEYQDKDIIFTLNKTIIN